MVLLSAEAIKGFTETLLASRYDHPKPIPPFHMELWEYCCSAKAKVAIAAPREHAKSTTITGAFVLARVLFRVNRHVMILSSNEELASAYVNDIRIELLENERLRDYFKIKRFIKEAETELIVEMHDGYRFRIIAKGAGQRMRGIKWDRKRPDLALVDDIEDDDIVMNKERREKFKRWFYGAVLPILGDGGQVRMVGTIIHMDSLLEEFMPDIKDPLTLVEPLKISSTKDKEWLAVKYRAHNEDMSHILWEDKFPAEFWRAKRRDYTERHMLDVYAQEYLNDPIDDSVAFFLEGWFKDSLEKIKATNGEWDKRSKQYYVGVDFAISKSTHADYTAMVVVAIDDTNELEIVHVRRGHWDAGEIVDNLFEIQKFYRPVLVIAEQGAIEKSIGPFLRTEMRNRNIFINLDTIVPTKDKAQRARPMQGRMRIGNVYFRKHEDWFPDLHEEMRRFPRAKHDDIVDALSCVFLTLDRMSQAPSREELKNEWEEEMDALMHAQTAPIGVNPITGY